MTVVERYLLYLQQISEGQRPLPEGMELKEEEPLAQAAHLQEQIMSMGIPTFVSLCAAQDGQELSQEELASFRQEDLLEGLQQLLAEKQPAAEEPASTEEPDNAAAPPQIDEPDGPRSAYEVLIDCCSLDEKLMYYLIDVLKREAEEEFQKLALVTARKAFTRMDFLYWFATKEHRARQDEMVCVTLMDACFDRLAKAGEIELIAALISGDRKTFELFRCEAPELLHLPDATYEWYEKHYLQGFYPLRYMLKFNGVSFPKEAVQ